MFPNEPHNTTKWHVHPLKTQISLGERGGSVVECRTPEREVRGSRPTAAVLCPWARHFTPRKYWLITQEAMAPSRHDWKIVDWDVKPQHNQIRSAWASSQQRLWSEQAILCVLSYSISNLKLFPVDQPFVCGTDSYSTFILFIVTVFSMYQVIHFFQTFEPCHEKTCFSHMRTTKVQISLRIGAVWSAPLLFAS